ncbi:MAG: RdgB/HAM1 family non-canonical purine NTP pyrophosphatase [Myxococcales bacterium]|nr:RdgB/HAM1 family non-canonical purine NTP pyrophosphatase [Myxococcales bacterium]
MTAEAIRVVVATNNEGKRRELQVLLPSTFALVSPRELELALDVDETEDTFEGNALLKARAFAAASGLHALADDSGLEVDALGGAPGVRSARYAGDDATDADNVDELLRALAGEDARSARFRCVLVLVAPNGDVVARAEGRCEGAITSAPRGDGGFGYDPVFVPAGDTRTMAELSRDEKNAISHRAAAARALRERLEG